MSILMNPVTWMAVSGVMTVVALVSLFWKQISLRYSMWIRRLRFNPEKFHESMKDIQDSFREAEERLRQDHENDPNNGKLGYWEITGLRHQSVVKASSAMEALKKTEHHVRDWETPRARFLGEQMPDIYEF